MRHRTRVVREGTVTGDPEVMLGPGGRVTVPQSESAVLLRAINRLRRVAGERGVNEWAHRELHEVVAELDALRAQAGAGYHRNPLMQVISNPSSHRYGALSGMRLVGEISRKVHAVQYTHAEDRQPYEHKFEHPTSLLAVERSGKHDVLITSPDGRSIWQDF